MMNMTDVTIRGIDDDIYNNFSAEARKRDTPLGEMVSKAMMAYIETYEANYYVIENVDKLEITKEQLESVGEPIAFLGIKEIIIDDSVDWNTFKRYVEEIRRCKKLTIPKTLTKFQVLTRCKGVKVVIEK